MSRWLRPTPVDDPATEPLPDTAEPTDAARPVVAEPGLAALPIAGLTRRRVAAAIAVVLAAWIVMVFVRQVGEASTATAKADTLAQGNIALTARVASLERELDLIARSRFVGLQARGYGLGTPEEVPFALSADAPPLPEDAPGSAALRVGTPRDDVTPLERWLTVLFGPED